MDTGWLSRRHADVPAGDDWLGEQERRAIASLAAPARRADWRLGRWTAKTALSRLVDAPLERMQVLAEPDGAPQTWLDGNRLPISLSISHRAGRAMVAVRAQPRIAGCDLELLEPRSDAFIGDWLAPSEQRLARGRGRLLAANLLWSGKEAASKVRRWGLTRDLRHAVVRLAPGQRPGEPWQPLRVEWDSDTVFGWWRAEPGWVMVVAGDPAPAMPADLELTRVGAR
jgi:4'-phosphopantetheinyl transferase